MNERGTRDGRLDGALNDARRGVPRRVLSSVSAGNFLFFGSIETRKFGIGRGASISLIATGMSSQVPPKAPQVATGSRHRNSKKRAEEWWNRKKLAWPALAAAVFAYACWEESSKSASR